MRTPTSSFGSRLFEVRADGSAGPVAMDGEALELVYSGERTMVTSIGPSCIEDASPEYALVAWATDLFPPDYPAITTLVRKSDGAVIPVGVQGFATACFRLGTEWRPGVQLDASGRLYVRNTLWYAGVSIVRRTLSTLEPAGPTVAELVRPGDDVESFVVNGGGDVAFLGDSTGGINTPDVQVFRSAAGSYTTSSLDPALGDVWVGLDGQFHATRATGDASGTVELVRLEVGATVTEVPTTSWQGAPTRIRGHPLRLGASMIFVEADRIWEFATLDAPPTAHPLDFSWYDVKAGEESLWFASARQPAGYALGLTRWTRAGQQTVLAPDGHYHIDRVFVIDDQSVIVSGLEVLEPGARSYSARYLVARVDASGVVTPIDVGEGGAVYSAVRLP